MTPFPIGGLQLDLASDHDNFARISSRLAHLVDHFPFVQMVLLSELATFGPSPNHAQPMPGPAEETFRELAAKHQIWLIPGSLFERTDTGIYNTAPVIAPDGTVMARYRKLFPFRPYENGIESGDQFCVFDVPSVGRFGVSICYDLWFPETTRTLAAMGAEVILHPVMTTTIDRDIELAMTRASAAMNQCYIFSVNGVGSGGNGRSIVCAPNGDVLHQAGQVEELIPLELDLDQVRRQREVGMWGLGQPLKSFRDRKVDFSVYTRGAPGFESLSQLGPLAKLSRPKK